MKLMQKIAKLYSLPVLLSWFLMSVFVDIIAVPTVFRNVTKVEEAGKVGMTVFTALNRMEIFFALIFILGSVAFYKRYAQKTLLALSLILFIWILSYDLYFTPQIIYFTKMIHSVPSNDPMLAVYQTNRAFYHHLYRYLDTCKLLMLLVSLFLVSKTNFTEEK